MLRELEQYLGYITNRYSHVKLVYNREHDVIQWNMSQSVPHPLTFERLAQLLSSAHRRIFITYQRLNSQDQLIICEPEAMGHRSQPKQQTSWAVANRLKAETHLLPEITIDHTQVRPSQPPTAQHPHLSMPDMRWTSVYQGDSPWFGSPYAHLWRYTYKTLSPEAPFRSPSTQRPQPPNNQQPCEQVSRTLHKVASQTGSQVPWNDNSTTKVGNPYTHLLTWNGDTAPTDIRQPPSSSMA